MRVAACIVLTGCNAVLGLAPTTPADAPGPDPNCPTTYQHVQRGDFGGDYRIDVIGGVSFAAAEAACAADGLPGSSRHTHLAVIGSASSASGELNLIESAIVTAAAVNYWVGLSDRVSPPTWRWVSTEVLPALQDGQLPWGPNDPQSQLVQECAALNRDSGALQSQNCSFGTLGYVCECDAFAEDLANF